MITKSKLLDQLYLTMEENTESTIASGSPFPGRADVPDPVTYEYEKLEKMIEKSNLPNDDKSYRRIRVLKFIGFIALISFIIGRSSCRLMARP